MLAIDIIGISNKMIPNASTARDPLPEPPALLQQNTPLPIWNILMQVLWHKWGTKLC